MAKIKGELEGAQIENLTADPTNLPDGRVFLNTTTGKPKVVVAASAKTIPTIDSADDLTNKTIAFASNTLTGVASTSTAQVISNKDIDGGTASNSNRITVPKAPKGTLDGLTRKQGTIVYDTTSNKPYYDDGTSLRVVGSGSGGSVNLIDNGDAESVQIFSLYADSGSRPVDGTGGTPGVAVSLDIPALTGSKSFVLQKPNLASQQGEGWSVPFTVEQAYRAKVLQIEFDYMVRSGTFRAGSAVLDSDVIVYIYDVTNSRLIEPSGIKLFSNSTTISDRFIANFQTSATGSSYKLLFHVATTTAQSFELLVDNVTVKPSTYVYGTPITDFQSWTPTVTGLGTLASSTFRWRRLGDSLHGVFTLVSGTHTAVPVSFTLPSSLSHSASNNQIVGKTATNKTPFSGGVGAFTSAPTLVYVTSDSADFSTAPNGTTWASTTVFSGEFIIPITGWSSSVQVSDGYDGRQIVFAGTQSSEAVTANVTNITFAVGKDNTASWSTNTFTVKSAGDYLANASGVSSAVGAALSVYKNGTLVGYGSSAPAAASATAASILVRDCVAGDVISFRSSVTTTLTVGVASIFKLQAPTTISATERVSTILSLPSGQALGSATTDTVIYTLKEEDTHGAYNTSTGEYKCPYQGRYDISILQTCSSRSSAAFDLTAYVFVNGVEKASLNNYSGVNTVIHIYPVNLTTSVLCNAGDIITIRSRAGYSGESLVANSAKNRASILRVK